MASAMAERHVFNRRVEESKPSKMDINFVIMDYLINEGYPAAAKKFAAEANIRPPLEASEYIEERVDIRNAILQGNIKFAIEQINDLDPNPSGVDDAKTYHFSLQNEQNVSQRELFATLTVTQPRKVLPLTMAKLLDTDSSLHFALLRLQLIELIRPCATSSSVDITAALEFAQFSLAPRAPTNPKFLEDLERTMALLIFSPDAGPPPPTLAGLLDPELRQDVATRVNEAILAGHGLRDQAKLKSLVKLRAWAEARARGRGKDIPATLDIWEDASTTESMHGDTTMSNEDEAETDSVAA